MRGTWATHLQWINSDPGTWAARRRITLRYEVFCNIMILRLLKLYARFEKYRRGEVWSGFLVTGFSGVYLHFSHYGAGL